MWDYVIFAIVYFANWSMDSLRFRYHASIFYKWDWLRETKFFGYKEFWKSDQDAMLRRFKNNDPLQGRKTILGVVIPQAFTDGWHFWKMFLVTGICILAANGIKSFIIIGALWLILWWLMYDVNYDTQNSEDGP